MRVDTNFFGTVPMADAGDPRVAPTSRRYGNADVIACYENILHWAETADGLDYDTLWLTDQGMVDWLSADETAPDGWRRLYVEQAGVA